MTAIFDRAPRYWRRRVGSGHHADRILMTDRPGSAPFVESAIAPSTAAAATDPERARIAEGATDQPGRWWALGPYMSERAWGTVREDYSADGRAWDSFPHDHARSRAYRWSEDGLAGMCDVEQRLCFALSFWNGRDPILRLRPGDANEVVEAWKVIMQPRHQPVALVLSRQAMPTLDRTRYAPATGVARGAYVLVDPPRGEPEVILMGTGSEVSLC